MKEVKKTGQYIRGSYNIIMVNPFDANFFKFLIGFICILLVSFGVLYIANSYNQEAIPAAAQIDR